MKIADNVEIQSIYPLFHLLLPSEECVHFSASENPSLPNLEPRRIAIILFYFSFVLGN